MLFLKLALSSNLPKHKLAQAAGIKTDPHSRGRLQTRFAPRAHRMNSLLNSLRFRWSHGSRKLSCWAVLEQHALVVQFRPRTRKKNNISKTDRNWSRKFELNRSKLRNLHLRLVLCPTSTKLEAKGQLSTGSLREEAAWHEVAIQPI